MNNINIELVVKTAGNVYRPIKVGEVVKENEHVENRVTANGNARVYFLKSKDGPGFPAKEARKIAGLTTYYGRILAIQDGENFIYVWAGKHPETDEALQRQQVLSQLEFEHVVGPAINETLTAEAKPEPPKPSTPEPPVFNGSGPVKVALRYKKQLEGKRAGAMLIPHSELLDDFGYSRAKKNNSREIQETLEDLGIAVVPDIYQNPHDHLLLALKSGYLCTHMPELLELEDPCEVIEGALERALA
jgi:hypothetical protein